MYRGTDVIFCFSTAQQVYIRELSGRSPTVQLFNLSVFVCWFTVVFCFLLHRIHPR